MRSSLALTTLLLAVLMGCSGEEFPETYAVTGTVMYEGKPVDKATVTLVPRDPGGRSASGVTDAEGNFAVRTYFTRDHQPEGALSGEYDITVSKMEVRELPEGLSPIEAQNHFAKLGPPKNLLPEAYHNPKTSGFKLTVEDESPEPLRLDLKG